MEEKTAFGTVFTPDWWMRREFETTFYEDFTIAERISWVKWIKWTYSRAFSNRHHSVKYFTEFVVALNWKLWYWHEQWNMELAKLYEKLWWDADLYAQETFKWEDLDYFYRMTD